jgi:hypothetical protein
MRRAAALVALLLALLPAGGAAAQELKRLFFTPEQRAALDERRKARLPDKPSAPAAESPTTRVDGYVKRSSGRSTVWLNGEPLVEGVQPEGLRLRRGGDPSRVTVIVDEDRVRADVRVGQTLDRSSGAIKDVIGDGQVRVERRGAPAR